MKNERKKLGLASQMGIALILGLLVGIIWQSMGWNPQFFKPFGDIFIRLIRMIVIPLVVSSLIAGAAGMGDLKKLGRVASKILIYYVATTAIAVTLGLILSNIFTPGIGITLDTGKELASRTREYPGFVSVILNLIPMNPFGAFAEGKLLQIIIFSLFFGFALSAVGERGKPIVHFFDVCMEVMIKITRVVMYYAPIGVFALIAFTVGKHGLQILLPLAKLVVVAYVAIILHILLVYTPAIKFLAKMEVKKFFKCMREPLIVAFSTCSSNATLPVNLRAVTSMGVPKSTASFTIPLGTTINMDGAAIYISLASLFVAQVYGISLSFGEQITILLMGLLSSIGAVGVPAYILVVFTMIFTQVGLPVEGIALIAGVDRIIDMGRTSLNVLGDATGACVVSAMEGELSTEPFKEDPVLPDEELEPA